MAKLLIIAGVVQGMVTGIRGLCNGVGPALFGLIFHIFNVQLKSPIDTAEQAKAANDSYNNVGQVLVCMYAIFYI